MTAVLPTPTPAGQAVVDRFVALLAEVTGRPVESDADFFVDLGADSMQMARFCARVRKHPDLPPVSMKDVYAARTVDLLVTRLPVVEERDPVTSATPAPGGSDTTGSPFRFGAAQLVAVTGYLVGVAALVLVLGGWTLAASGAWETYLRLVAAGSAALLVLCAFPVVTKWLLVGRWTPRRIPLWSAAHLRFWLVATLVRTSPLALFVGSPLLLLHLRLLGARIGPGAVFLSRHVPVCTDLLEVGAGAVVRKDALLTCYSARRGEIRTGRVRVGARANVGEAAVLDIDTAVGDDARLGHSSSLHAGMSVPPGTSREGSPATQGMPGGHDLGSALAQSAFRRVGYPVFQLLATLLVLVPAAAVAAGLVGSVLPVTRAADAGPGALADPRMWGGLLGWSAVIFAAVVLGGLLLVGTVPRLVAQLVRPERDYPLYGVRYWAHRTVGRLTNVMFFTYLFGDSSYVVPYLRWLGYDLDDVEQTGSNFGLEMQHETPYHLTVGRGTMVADGLSVINADYSATSFRVRHVAIGRQSFLGNYVHYPAEGRAGDNVLLATKVTIPRAGPVRADQGLLGSPAFDIPRTVQRDGRFDHLATGAERDRRLRRKNRHNAVTMGLFLLTRWAGVALVGVLAVVTASLQPLLGPVLGAVSIGVAGVAALAVSVLWLVLVERLAGGPGRLAPQFCSIYQPYFWWHERYWKLGTQLHVLNGTAFKPLVWRLLGVRIGKRVFDDGSAINEKPMVEIGDDCVLNVRSIVQPHSQEDGTFKSDRITLGRGATVDVGALVHYGVVMGAGSHLAADSFLMKGEDVPPDARWGGNPAVQLTRGQS